MPRCGSVRSVTSSCVCRPLCLCLIWHFPGVVGCDGRVVCCDFGVIWCGAGASRGNALRSRVAEHCADRAV